MLTKEGYWPKYDWCQHIRAYCPHGDSEMCRRLRQDFKVGCAWGYDVGISRKSAKKDTIGYKKCPDCGTLRPKLNEKTYNKIAPEKVRTPSAGLFNKA